MVLFLFLLSIEIFKCALNLQLSSQFECALVACTFSIDLFLLICSSVLHHRHQLQQQIEIKHLNYRPIKNHFHLDNQYNRIQMDFYIRPVCVVDTIPDKPFFTVSLFTLQIVCSTRMLNKFFLRKKKHTHNLFFIFVSKHFEFEWR